MTNKPLISIITPSYNVEDYIQDCLNSVYEQTYTNLEIIIVDDASTDNTQQILLNNKERKKSINIIFLNENGGPGKCRNIGLKHAKGEYVYFLDADDYIAKDTLSTIIEYMPSSSDICIFEGITIEYPTSNILKNKYFHLRSDFFYRKRILKQYRPMLFDCHSPCLKLYSSHFLAQNAIRFPEGVYGEDVEFWIKCVLATNKIAYTAYKGYYRRIRKGSIMTANSIKNVRDRIDNFESLLSLSSEDTLLYNYIVSQYIPVNLKRAYMLQDKELVTHAELVLKKLATLFD